MPGLPRALNLTEAVAYLVEFVKTFPDSVVTINELIAEGERVVSRYTMTGSQTNGFQGLPPTQNTPFNVPGVAVITFHNGLRIHQWEMRDELLLLQQISPRKASFVSFDQMTRFRPTPPSGRPSPARPAPVLRPGSPVEQALESLRTSSFPPEETLILGTLKGTSVSLETKKRSILTQGIAHNLTSPQPATYTAELRALKAIDLQQLLKQKPSFTGLPSKPGGIPKQEPLGEIAIRFDLADGDLLEARGYISAALSTDESGDYLLLFTIMATITHGTGAHEGANGVFSSTGWSKIGPSLDAQPAEVNYRASFIFRISRASAPASLVPPSLPTDLRPSFHGQSVPDHEPPSLLITGLGAEVATIREIKGISYIVARGDMFTLNGRPLGYYIGTFELSSGLDLESLFPGDSNTPSTQNGTTKPADESAIIGRLKVRFWFHELGTTSVVGSATAKILPLPNGDSLFMIAASGTVSDGKGAFQRVSGLECECGSAVIPKGSRLGPGTSLFFRTYFQQQVVFNGENTAARARAAGILDAIGEHGQGLLSLPSKGHPYEL